MLIWASLTKFDLSLPLHAGHHGEGLKLDAWHHVLGGVAVDVEVADFIVLKDEEAGVLKVGSIQALAFIGDEGFGAFFDDALDADGLLRLDGPAFAKVGGAVDAVIQGTAEAEVTTEQVFHGFPILKFIGGEVALKGLHRGFTRLGFLGLWRGVGVGLTSWHDELYFRF